jgi:hypothetical protein
MGYVRFSTISTNVGMWVIACIANMVALCRASGGRFVFGGVIAIIAGTALQGEAHYGQGHLTRTHSMQEFVDDICAAFKR